MSEKQDVLDNLYRIAPGNGVILWDDFIIDVFARALRKSRVDAERMATDTNIRRYWNWLLKRLEEDEKLGRTPLFEVYHKPTRKLLWHTDAASRQINAADDVTRLAQRSRRNQILNAIDLIDDRQYEALGCKICSMIGADNIQLTPKSDDAGIDFFAAINLRQDNHVLSGNGCRLRVIGQSKQYKSRVAEAVVTQLIQTINEVKNRSQEIVNIVPAWFYTTPGPIVGWISAHAGFQQGAISKARWHGIIITDSIDAAELFACNLPNGTPYGRMELSDELDQIISSATLD